MYNHKVQFLTDQLQFLGLNAREIRVFLALVTFGRMKMTIISSRANVARTSVHSIVGRLERQGIVTREKVGKHWEYLIDTEAVAQKVALLQSKLLPINAQSVNGRVLEGDKITHSINDFDSEIEQYFLSHKGERASILLSVLGTGRERVVEFEHCLQVAIKAQSRIELLTCDHVANDFSQHAREMLTLLSNYELRLNILPSAYCLSGVDLIAFRDIAIALDHHTRKIEVLQAPIAVVAVNHLMFVARETGWNIDLRVFLESRIESQRKL